MAHGLVGTNMTGLNVETVSASVKPRHYDSMFASMKERNMTSKITNPSMWAKNSLHTLKHVI